MSRRFHGFPAWIAALALVLNALWPLLQHARPASAGDFTAEICTIGGLASAARTSGSDMPAPAAPAHAQSHCALCSLGDSRLAVALLPLPMLYAVPPSGHEMPVATGQVPPRSSSAHPHARPRAPPRSLLS